MTNGAAFVMGIIAGIFAFGLLAMVGGGMAEQTCKQMSGAKKCAYQMQPVKVPFSN